MFPTTSPRHAFACSIFIYRFSFSNFENFLSLDLAASCVAFVIILFLPSLQPIYLIVSFSWFVVLVMEWSCMNAYERREEIKSRKSIKEIETIFDENIIGEPKIITQCEARRLCCVIWREQKEFEFQHWIDVTDQHLVKTQIEEAIVGELKVEIEFDDEETKESYEQHVQNLVKEAKQHSPNAPINIKHIFQVGEKDIETIRRSPLNPPLFRSIQKCIDIIIKHCFPFFVY